SSSCLSSHSSSSSLHTLSLHDALPIYSLLLIVGHSVRALPAKYFMISACYDGNPTGFSMPVVHTSNYTLRAAQPDDIPQILQLIDRKSTRLNSSHVSISYAVFCLKKKK